MICCARPRSARATITIETFYLSHHDLRRHVDHQTPSVHPQVQDHGLAVRETAPELALAVVQFDHAEGVRSTAATIGPATNPRPGLVS